MFDFFLYTFSCFFVVVFVFSFSKSGRKPLYRGLEGRHCIILHRIKTTLERLAKFHGYNGRSLTNFFFFELLDITENNAFNQYIGKKLISSYLYISYIFCRSIFKPSVVSLGHQTTEDGEETFSDTTHGCSFSVMFIIRFMVKNGSSVLMVLGVLYCLNALVSLQL